MKRIFIFGLIVTGFLFFVSCSLIGHQSPCYIKIARKITENTANKLKQEKNLCLVGTGGQMMNDIQMMMMGFNFYDVVDIETARKLLVDSVEEYLFAINSSEKIRPHLHNYPFTYKNIEIVIYFRSQNGCKVPSGEIKIAESDQGSIAYYVDYPEKHTIKSVYEETYEEAFRAVYPKKRESEALSS